MKPLILFDGVCNLCNGAVNFVIDHDKRQNFVFASLQSEEAAKVLLELDDDLAGVDSIVLIEDNQAFVKSTAALKITRRLSFPWNLAYVFILLPKFLRDPIYDLIARNRYKWFGKRDQCRIPTEDLRARFIENF